MDPKPTPTGVTLAAAPIERTGAAGRAMRWSVGRSGAAEASWACRLRP